MQPNLISTINCDVFLSQDEIMKPNFFRRTLFNETLWSEPKAFGEISQPYLCSIPYYRHGGELSWSMVRSNG